MEKKDLTYKEAIQLLIQEFQRPISLDEIERELNIRGDRKSVIASGIRSVLNTDIKKGENSIFIRVGKGLYNLRNPEKTISYPSKDRKVLVIKNNNFQQLGYFIKLNNDFSKYKEGLLNTKKPIFINRLDAEEGSEDYKQIVNYIIIRHKNKLLRFTRPRSKVNRYYKYLDGNLSIGIGGHVNDKDYYSFDFQQYNDSGYYNSFWRELSEETGIKEADVESEKMVCVLNDDTTPRGVRHLAFVHIVDVKNECFEENDDNVRNLKYVTFDEISSEINEYEYWSRLCLHNLFPNELLNKCSIKTTPDFSLSKHTRFLAITGEICSGKSELSNMISEKFGYHHVKCSSLLLPLIGLGPEAMRNRKKLQDEGLKFISKKGAHQRYANSIYEYLKQFGLLDKYIIFDGLRYPESLQALEKVLGVDIPIIYVSSNIELQYKNYKLRDSKTASLDDFLKVITHPVERKVNEFMSLSKITILNHGSYEALQKSVETFFNDEVFGYNLSSVWSTNARLRHQQIIRGNDLTFEYSFKPNFLKEITSIENHTKLFTLDIGCGSGILTKLLSTQLKFINAIDYSDESIIIAKEESNTKNIDYFYTSLENFHPDRLFDLAISNMTFHTIDDYKEAILHTSNLLKLNSKLIFTIPHPFFYPQRKHMKKYFNEDNYNYSEESFHKIPFRISLEPEPLPILTPYFHRPIINYINALSNAGFEIEKIFIPYPSRNILEKYPDKWEKPHILMFVVFKIV